MPNIFCRKCAHVIALVFAAIHVPFDPHLDNSKKSLRPPKSCRSGVSGKRGHGKCGKVSTASILNSPDKDQEAIRSLIAIATPPRKRPHFPLGTRCGHSSTSHNRHHHHKSATSSSPGYSLLRSRTASFDPILNSPFRSTSISQPSPSDSIFTPVFGIEDPDNHTMTSMLLHENHPTVSAGKSSTSASLNSPGPLYSSPRAPGSSILNDSYKQSNTIDASILRSPNNSNSLSASSLSLSGHSTSFMSPLSVSPSAPRLRNSGKPSFVTRLDFKVISNEEMARKTPIKASPFKSSVLQQGCGDMIMDTCSTPSKIIRHTSVRAGSFGPQGVCLSPMAIDDTSDSVYRGHATASMQPSSPWTPFTKHGDCDCCCCEAEARGSPCSQEICTLDCCNGSDNDSLSSPCSECNRANGLGHSDDDMVCQPGGGGGGGSPASSMPAPLSASRESRSAVARTLSPALATASIKNTPKGNESGKRGKRERTPSSSKSTTGLNVPLSNYNAKSAKGGKSALKDLAGQLEVSSRLKSDAGGDSKDCPSGNGGEPLAADGEEFGDSKPCNCKKSKCLKLYCECFARQAYCQGCNCAGCHNVPEHEEERQLAIKGSLDRDPNAFFRGSKKGMIELAGAKAKHRKGCNCKKSHCLKKYCECYQANVPCSDSCRCTDCHNGKDGFSEP